jgi:formylglycine-generating enzyme required for sulfatase activity
MKSMLKLALVWLVLLPVASCSFESDPGTTIAPTSAPATAPTVVFTPIVLPTIATVAPPPTPTFAPTATPAPVQAGATPAPVAAINTEMVDIPAGAFPMGSANGGPDAKPVHQVDVPAFKMDKFEVTNADFKKFVDATSFKTDSEKAGDTDTWQTYAKGKDLNPVVKVSFNDAELFCKWAGKRLPTEAEWEKAARGTDGRAFPWGNDYDPKKANVKESGLRTTTVVGSFGAGASPYGVQDMAGNVWEWTSSAPTPYPGGVTTGKLFTPNTRIARGGGWFDIKDQVASYARNSYVLVSANDDLGFRCAK